MKFDLGTVQMAIKSRHPHMAYCVLFYSWYADFGGNSMNMKEFHKKEIKFVYNIPYTTFHDNVIKYRAWKKEHFREIMFQETRTFNCAPPRSTLPGGIEAERAEVAQILNEDLRKEDFEPGSAMIKRDVLEYIEESGIRRLDDIETAAKNNGLKDVVLQDFDLWFLERKASDFLQVMRQHGYNHVPMTRGPVVIGYTQAPFYKEMCKYVMGLNHKIAARQKAYPDGVLRDNNGVVLPGQPRPLSGRTPQGHSLDFWGSCFERDIANIGVKQGQSNCTSIDLRTPQQVMRDEETNLRKPLTQVILEQRIGQNAFMNGDWVTC